MDTLLCLVRHGATDWNFDMRAQGHFDQPLNDEGRRQAERVAARLATEPWDAIYASDLSRARETAAAIASRLGLPVHLEPGLRERNMGVLEGVTLRERRMRFGDIGLNALPGVESDASLQARALETIGRIAAAHRGERVVCVSHGALLSSFLTAITGEPPQTHTRNTAVTLIRWDGARFTPELCGCHSHLLEPSGLEYSGERGRIRPRALRELYEACGMPEAAWDDDRLKDMVELSLVAWGAWDGGRLVGFARGVTDGVSIGIVDRCAVHPDWKASSVLHDLIGRVRARFPLVEWIER